MPPLRENKNHILKLQTKAQAGEKEKVDVFSERDSSQSRISVAEKIKESGIGKYFDNDREVVKNI